MARMTEVEIAVVVERRRFHSTAGQERSLIATPLFVGLESHGCNYKRGCGEPRYGEEE